MYILGETKKIAGYSRLNPMKDVEEDTPDGRKIKKVVKNEKSLQAEISVIKEMWHSIWWFKGLWWVWTNILMIQS